MTLHLNRKHVLFQKKIPQWVLKTHFLVTTKTLQSRAETDFFRTYSTSFWKIGVFLPVKSPKTFRKVCTKIIKTIAHNTKRRRPRFRKKSKAVFLGIRYRKTSQTQDVKSQSTERSARKIAQPKCESAFEQKTRIVSCREISASSQNSFFIYNQRIKPRRAQKDISGTYSTHNVVLESFCFAQETKAVFISIRYPKTSQTQDLKSQSTERSARKIAQPKCESAFEHKTRIVSSRKIWGSSENRFF